MRIEWTPVQTYQPSSTFDPAFKFSTWQHLKWIESVHVFTSILSWIIQSLQPLHILIIQIRHGIFLRHIRFPFCAFYQFVWPVNEKKNTLWRTKIRVWNDIVVGKLQRPEYFEHSKWKMLQKNAKELLQQKHYTYILNSVSEHFSEFAILKSQQTLWLAISKRQSTER